MPTSAEAEQGEGSFDIINSLSELPLDKSNVPHRHGVAGGAPLLQTLYEGPRVCSCCTNWVDYLPANADADTDGKDGEDLPIVIRNSVTRGEDTSRVSIHSVEIRDSAARGALFPVFEGFDRINPSINYLVFHAPFKPFFYRWSRFEEALRSCTVPRTKAILMQLHTIVKVELAEAFAIWDELVKNGVISYPYLWTIFQPGEIICEDTPGSPCFYYTEELEVHTHQRAGLRLDVQYVDYNYHFGLVGTEFYIGPFQGTRNITDLPVYPARFLPDFESVKQTVVERGRKFSALAGVHYKEYANHTPDGEKRKQYRRIVVDSQGGMYRKPVLSPLKGDEEIICDTGGITQVPLDAPPLGGHTSLKPNRWDETPSEPGYRRDDVYVDDRRRGGQRTRRVRNVSPDYYPTGDEHEESQDLDEFHLQLCTNTVEGFCLQNRAWETFFVDGIRDIEWSPDPFNSLVLPDGYKDLVLSFAEAHVGGDQTFGDVVHGKGSGLVVSLTGPPGVGKTLTAESVAEVLKVPLYVLDLGQVADEIEDDRLGRPIVVDRKSRDRPTITDAFSQAARWKSLLLVDECDLYLEPRSESTPLRNRIVTKFLREIEYSSSLVILTTNRPDALDPAIASRVHLTVTYPELDRDSRKAIWEVLLAHQGASGLSTNHLGKLADLELNGRRIRNVAKAAAIMARRNRRGVEFGDIKTVLRITEGYSMEPEFK